MRLRITIAMLEIRNRKTLQSKVNICKSDVKIGDYADSLPNYSYCILYNHLNCSTPVIVTQLYNYCINTDCVRCLCYLRILETDVPML